MCDAILISPPQWFPGRPFLSIPALTAFLQSKEYDVIQRDANIAFYNWILSKDILKSFYSRIDKDIIEKKDVASKFKVLSLTIDSLLETIENTKESIKTQMMNTTYYLQLTLAFEIISLAHYPTILNLNSYSPPDLPFTQLITNTSHNPFIIFLEKFILPLILEKRPTMVGISVNAHSQVIPSLTLSHLIKKENPHVHICLGGNTFSRSEKELPILNPLFDYVDSIIFYDGETALASLISCIEKEGDFSTVPNLMYRDGTRLKRSRVSHTEDINALPPPSFAGFPLTEYFSPMLILPLQTSRGCYWSRCTFCAIPHGEGHTYRSRNPDRVVEDMISLQTTYGARYFEFVDDAIPPQKLRHLSKRLISEDMGVRWGAEVRLEPQFTADLLTQMHKSGCRILYFGLESANPRILSLMDKGTDVSTAQKILYDSHEAGIWNHVYVFFGFPTETEAEAEDTISFIQNHTPIINSVGFGRFLLYRNSKIYQHHQDFGITKILKKKSPLSFIFDYESSNGLNNNQITSCENRMKTIIHDTSRGLAPYYEWLAMIPLIKKEFT